MRRSKRSFGWALDKQQKSGWEVELGGERKINSDEFIVLKALLKCNNH